MPVFRKPHVKGNLYVQFTIQFPDSGFLEESQLKVLECLLPTGPDPPALDPEAEEVDMIESEGTRGVGGAQRGGAIYDEDEEDEGVGGAQRVGCSQQ
ncbi:dnaJ homolog subfamily A member 2-like [Halichondria panicea]|uniref:dnaJ homolog subfamily A member 2-like n=1 Tax=Halichondria panicea TaxID=6063 RepID=UPI00312B8D88